MFMVDVLGDEVSFAFSKEECCIGAEVYIVCAALQCTVGVIDIESDTE